MLSIDMKHTHTRTHAHTKWHHMTRYTAGYRWGIVSVSGHTFGTFVWLVYIYVFAGTLSALFGDTRDFWFNPNMQNSGLWSILAHRAWILTEHVNYILTANASLQILLGAISTHNDIWYATSPLNSSNVLPIILCWLYCVHFQMWRIYCWKINADNKVVDY